MIPKTEEKYISYSFNNLRFLDSLAFMCPDDSLEKLVESLRNKDQYDVSKFKHTQTYFKTLYPILTHDQMKLVITKGVYPYSIWIALKGLMKPLYPVKICFTQV